MRFEHEGRLFQINFQRLYKPVRNLNRHFGQPEFIPSRFPYTRAFITIIEADPDHPGRYRDVEVYREAEVGCHFHEKAFSPEKGRTRALRQICRTVDKGFKAAIFDCYLNR